MLKVPSGLTVSILESVPAAPRNTTEKPVALMIVSGVLTIPLPGLPVPIVLQNMMMMLAGGLLGKKFGTLAVSVFLLMVAVGFPVLSGGRGGIAVNAGSKM